MEELKEQYDWRKGRHKIMKRRCNDDGSRIKGVTWRRFGDQWYFTLSDAYDAIVRIVRNRPELYRIGG